MLLCWKNIETPHAWMLVRQKSDMREHKAVWLRKSQNSASTLIWVKIPVPLNMDGSILKMIHFAGLVV